MLAVSRKTNTTYKNQLMVKNDWPPNLKHHNSLSNTTAEEKKKGFIREKQTKSLLGFLN